ncbi:bifunctional D-glycero-beta-D-manno-heptose-7-phosphate kinase/D-glycero-beta-D-manno-heptose 1-phosphate adenylyltransferase HldE [Sulfurivirga sp.]|uniref:bifunctional D-glycero-beta-D-manno-heptose-7-phosphate kinase/D-glycero-beta-D-manno-heptose 1-phosphate adenylyltransferase HldE n=1 Tax=Sulfurivirga sp. TaxID=2614236 RepID=UPI002600115B|nr:bifunctional D-glycero-beta-D-manno-heptose-7-phosphate kinase/D-glycero-beta-D-manno-heptose 1-phosphate adenylyltransferase HldE [Sulfurivirga sp.]
MLSRFSTARVLVVGDVMLDRYWQGRAGRISPEAPVPVVNVTDEQARAGGAANVATNIAALGGQVTLMGVIGHDREGEALERLVRQQGVESTWVHADSGTISKLRVLSHHQQLIRMDFEQPAPPEAAEALAAQVAEQVADHDLLVLSDYAKGALGQVEGMIEAARRAGVPVFVDPKGRDFGRYRGATLIKPNQKEFELVAGVCRDEAEIEARGQTLIDQLSLSALLVTRSEHGMLLLEKGQPSYPLRAQTQEVFDVTGAGDTVMAVLATAHAAGHDLRQAAWLANEAASLVVRKVGTSVVTAAELSEHLRRKQAHLGYVAPDVDTLREAVRAAQARGERVVMTNGCFDILHAGHVRYLQEAAQLGDRLIVAVNSDDSVRRLKGDSRPVVPLQARMEVLAALGCVDWVIPFDEDTPARLICALKPDVLVKGGDYRPEEIAGADCVQAEGGEVRVLSFWDGFSTTDIVNRIREQT